MTNLKGMNVEALMSLRDQVDERLLELRAELEKQLAALTSKGKAVRMSLKGRKVRRFRPDWRCAGFAAVARVGEPLASTPVNDLRHGLEGEFTEGHELDRKWRVPKEMIGRRLSQEEAKGLLAKFE